MVPYYKLIRKYSIALVKEAFTQMASEGIDPKSSIIIDFSTFTEGVSLSDIMRQRYPKKMTVLLDDTIQDLTVTETGFSATLEFLTHVENIHVPYESFLGFEDKGADIFIPFPIDETTTMKLKAIP